MMNKSMPASIYMGTCSSKTPIDIQFESMVEHEVKRDRRLSPQRSYLQRHISVYIPEVDIPHVNIGLLSLGALPNEFDRKFMVEYCDSLSEENLRRVSAGKYYAFVRKLRYELKVLLAIEDATLSPYARVENQDLDNLEMMKNYHLLEITERMADPKAYKKLYLVLISYSELIHNREACLLDMYEDDHVIGEYIRQMTKVLDALVNYIKAYIKK